MRNLDPFISKGAHKLKTKAAPTKFTVVLLKPDFLCDDNPYGQEIYVALVKGRTPAEAIEAAREEVAERDRKDYDTDIEPDGYALCVMFDGHHNPALFGWQL